MNTDPTSLDLLHDLVVPAPTPWWPPAPGWLWLLGFVALVVLALLLRGIIRWQRNRYRREALEEIDQLEAGIQKGESPDGLSTLAEILKRTAVTAYSREQVAYLTGLNWFAFLDSTAGTSFADGLGAALEQAIYHDDPDVLDAQQLQSLLQQSRQWIRRHGQQPLPNVATRLDGLGVNETTLG